METKQIMLVCAAGMSTSLMVSKMEKAAQDQGLDAHIFAVPVPEAKEYLQNNAVDVLLLGPQVRYLKNEFSADLSARGIPVEVIPMTDYGMMKGSRHPEHQPRAQQKRCHGRQRPLQPAAQGGRPGVQLRHLPQLPRLRRLQVETAHQLMKQLMHGKHSFLLCF